MRALTPLEARVLGVLVEKQATVPDTYPLSLNALAAGCNQKTARDPVMAATDADVLAAVDGLKHLSLVFEGSGSRVVKFEHNAPRMLGLPGQSVALLATLMLRGPQTSAELRVNSERLHRFADISSVEGFLDEMAAKDPPRVVRLPRASSGGLEIGGVVAALAERGLQRIFVEGGGITVSRFLAAGALDRLHVTVAPLLLGAGIPAFTLPGVAKPEDGLRLRWNVHRLGDDLLFDIPLQRA